MAPAKKVDDKAKDQTAAQISVEDFIRTRDSVVTGLSTLQSAVSDLSRAYISHTNAVLGKGASTSLDQLNFANPLGGESVLFNNPPRGPTPAPTIELVDGKKRKRAPHDKNAPKRALTPFFLYLQTARPQIAQQMPGHTAKGVQDEGGKRWREMAESEKEVWNTKYGINFARYKEHMKAYKAGLPLPEVSEAEAEKLYEKNKKAGKVPVPAQADAGKVQEADESDETEDSSSDEDSPEPPPIAKKQKVNKESAKKKSSAAKSVEVVVSPVAERSSQSPEKKKKKGPKKRDSKRTEAIVEPSDDDEDDEVASPRPKQPKKKGRKRKSEVNESP